MRAGINVYTSSNFHGTLILWVQPQMQMQRFLMCSYKSISLYMVHSRTGVHTLTHKHKYAGTYY